MALASGLFASPAGSQELEGPDPASSATDIRQLAEILPDIAYGPDSAERLDVYRPHAAKDAPIIVMVHGGAWMFGSKTASRVVDNKVRHWLPRGYVFVSVEYRLSFRPNVMDEAADVAAALSYVQHHAGDWGGNGKRIVLMGHSAGAHLVSLLASDPGFIRQAGGAPWQATIALDSAGYDIPRIMQASHYRFYDRVFGKTPALWQQASPLLRLAGAPVTPMMLVCSSKRTESCPQSADFAQAILSKGGKATVLQEPLSHSEINGTLGGPSAYTEAVDSFLHTLGLP